MKQPSQSFISVIVNPIGHNKQVLDCNKFQPRTSIDVKKSIAIFEAPLAVSRSNVQWNRLGSTKPLVANVKMTTAEILCDGE